MNKPEPTRAQNLEEILASIRQSLTQEPALPADAAGNARAEPAAVKAAPEANGVDHEAADGIARGAGLSNRLAVALNGSHNGAAGLDDDLADLLSDAPRTTAAPVAAHAPQTAEKTAEKTAHKTAETGGEQDPLWFLTRQPGAADTPGAALANGSAAAKPAVEEPKLSRPETLRPSLPPLFGANAERAPASPAPVDTVKPADAGSARFFKAQEPAPERTAEAALGKAGVPAEDAAPVAAAADQAPAMEAGATPATASAAVAPDGAAAAEAGPAGPLQSKALEQMIAQLLEPVLRNWLEQALPGMVEKVIREEVARAVAAERSAPKM